MIRGTSDVSSSATHAPRKDPLDDDNTVPFAPPPPPPLSRTPQARIWGHAESAFAPFSQPIITHVHTTFFCSPTSPLTTRSRNATHHKRETDEPAANPT